MMGGRLPTRPDSTVEITEEDKVYFVNVALGDGEEKGGPRKEAERVNKKEEYSL